MTDYQFMDAALSHYVGGNFHSEGFADKEFIQAVGLYYFDVTKNIQGGGLTFKDPGYRHFGGASDVNIEVKDNDCVFFTNLEFKHKVQAMNINGTMGNNVSTYDKNGKQIFG
eukprot:371162_1